VNPDPQQDTTPSVLNPDWVLLAAKGEAGISGDDTPYDATGWNGSLSPPSQNAVRDVIVALPTLLNLAQYAPRASPALTGTPTTPTPATNSNNTQIANTIWARSVFAPLESPNLVGNPSTTVPATNDDSGRIAPTSWVRTTATAIATTLVNAAASQVVQPVGQPQIHRLSILGVTIFFGRVALATSNNLDYAATIGLPVSLVRFLAGVASISTTSAGDARVFGVPTVDGSGSTVQILVRNNVNSTPITTQVSFVVFGTV